MNSLIKHPKDFYAGLMYAMIGLGAIVIARDYNMGSSVRMGPGYFPTVLGGLLALVGLVSIARSFLHAGEPVKAFFWKGIFLVLGSVVVFGLLVRGAGLVPAMIIMVLMSAPASEQFRWRTALPLAIAVSVFSALVFVKGLGLPLAAFGPWFGF